MTREPDIPLMHRFPFGDDVADRLLSGTLPAASTPEGYSSVAALFEAATGPATSGELAHGAAFAAMAASAVLETIPEPPRSRNVLKKVMTVKAAAIAATLAFGMGAAAAAATGSLPGQSHASSNAVGLAIATSHRSTTTSSSTAAGAKQTNTSGSSIPATGPANQHAQFGLCTAFLNGQKPHGTTTTSTAPTTTSLPPQYSSTAFKALIAQNGGVAATTTYCKGVVANHQASTGSGASDQGKPANPGNSTSHNTSGGKPADTGKPAGTGKPATNTHPDTTQGKPASSD